MRHGESEGNAAGVLQGQGEYPLSATGILQAQAVSNRFAREHVSFNKIITSPLSRALATAEIIATKLQVPIEQNVNWKERNNGHLAGLRSDEIAERYPTTGTTNLYHPVGETGESQWELYLRAGHAVQDLLRQPPGRYLVVSHGGILNLVMYVILGIVPQTRLGGPRFRFQNTGFAVLEYNPERHAWLLERLGDRKHWNKKD